ncbi:MAG: hypothetical protein SVG88_08950 [Halobacteriales archaeon]|nr:hypothetical protein [Halobacteriales archaeon]
MKDTEQNRSRENGEQARPRKQTKRDHDTDDRYGRAATAARYQQALGNQAVSRYAETNHRSLTIGDPEGLAEREAEQVAAAVMSNAISPDSVDVPSIEQRHAIVRRQDAEQSREPDAGDQPQRDHQQDGPQRAPWAGDQQGNQQNQQQDQGNENPPDLTDDQITKFTATVLAESSPGPEMDQDERANVTRQEDEIKWVYYHNVVELGFERGLGDRSAAYSNESGGYKFWMTVLGDDTYSDHQPPAWGDARENYDTMAAFVDAIGGRYDDRAEYLETQVRDMFQAPTQEQRENFTGQGNLDDLNNESRYWRRARQYYRLQEGLADVDVNPAELETYVVVVRGQTPNNPSFIFQDSEIQTYFNNHPEHMPDTVAEISLEDINP